MQDIDWRWELIQGNFIDIFDGSTNKWVTCEILRVYPNGDMEYCTTDRRRGGVVKSTQRNLCEKAFSKSAPHTNPPKEIPKEPEWVAKLQKGDLIDVKDNNGKWRLADYQRKLKTNNVPSYFVRFHDNSRTECCGVACLAAPFTKSTTISAPSQLVPKKNPVPQVQMWDVRKLKVDDFLDIVDFEGVWLEAMIMQIDHKNDKIYVHFIGFAKRWDEWICRSDKTRFAEIQTKIPVSARRLPNKPIYRHDPIFQRIATRGFIHQKQILELNDLVVRCYKFETEVKKHRDRNLQQNSAAVEALRKNHQSLEINLQQEKTSGFQDENHEFTFKMCQNLVNSYKTDFGPWVGDDANDVGVSGRK